VFTSLVIPIDAFSNIVKYLNNKCFCVTKMFIEKAGSAPKMLNLKVLVFLTLEIMCK
jgi:hypothetical protein